MSDFIHFLFGPDGLERKLNGLIWGVPAMVLIIGAGLYLSIRCGFPQFTKFISIMKNTAGKAFRKAEVKEGSVSPFKAMCTALAASIGTGNIAGVSGAIAIGGPGAVFWMWISALVGMCTKFSEITLAVKYREKNSNGDWIGGPMYYIKNGLGKKWKWLAALFAVFGSFAAFGAGNLTQINAIASTVNTAIHNFIPTSEKTQFIIALIIGVIVAVAVFIVLIGGISRIADVCALIVPFMAVIYIIAALGVILLRIQDIPEVFSAIVRGAFHPESVAGGLAGVGIRTAITKGVSRGIFSNEAGLGTAPIAHAAADVDHPAKQGIFGIFEVFMDTIVVCTMTAMVVLLGVGVQNIDYGTDIGANLTTQGFTSVFGDKLPGIVVAVCLTLFAFSTILTWALYGIRCLEFLLGDKAQKPYLIVFCIALVIGSVSKLQIVWNIADTLNGLMAIPNLIAILLLSPVVIQCCKEYFAEQKQKKAEKSK